MIVAFGHNDKQFFIAAGRSTESHRLPTSMHNQIVGELRTPIEFASWGPGEPGHVKYFLSGYAPANANTRRSRMSLPLTVCEFAEHIRRQVGILGTTT